MMIIKFLPILSISLILLPLSFPLITHADTNFTIENNCNKTVWAASFQPSGGQKLDKGNTWTLTVAPGTNGSRIWGRTGCNFDSEGNGQCMTGNCDNGLVCKGPGKGPATLAEFSINQPGNLDYYDISIADGFNIPMSFALTSVPSGRPDCASLQCDSSTCLSAPAVHTCTSGLNYKVVFCP